MIKSEFIKKIASEVGFDLCGVASICNFSADKSFFVEWLAEGRSGGLDYLERNVDKRFSVEQLVPNAKSVISCAVSYKNDSSCVVDWGDSPKVASYARTEIYHDLIKNMLRQLADRLAEEYGKFGHRVFSDTAPMLEKRWAVECGLGFIGRNSLLITPEYGSFVVLGELVIDAEVDEYDKPFVGGGCGECHRCVEGCPAGALGVGGIDARRCISRRTIEREVADEECLAGLNGWIFGCDECQNVCPYNQHTPLYSNLRFEPLFNPLDMEVADWQSLTKEEFDARFGRTPLSRAGYERIRKSVISKQ